MRPTTRATIAILTLASAIGLARAAAVAAGAETTGAPAPPEAPLTLKYDNASTIRSAVAASITEDGQVVVDCDAAERLAARSIQESPDDQVAIGIAKLMISIRDKTYKTSRLQ